MPYQSDFLQARLIAVLDFFYVIPIEYDMNEKKSIDKKTLINFPEKFPTKIFGNDEEIFHQTIREIINQHVEAEHLLEIRHNTSKNARFAALTVILMAQNQAQLDAIYMDLTHCEHVKMAL